MHLEFTEQQLELKDTARTILERECPPSLVREVAEKGTGADRLWATLAELGWPALTVPEANDGLGMGFVELAVVLEELGHAAAPGPYLATTTQFLPVVRSAGADEWLARIAQGEVTGSLALLHDDPKVYVLSGTQVSHIAVIVRTEQGEPALAVAATSDLPLEPMESLDPTRPLATLSCDDVDLAGDQLLPLTEADLARVLEEATVGMALDTVGACQAILDMSLAYAKDREQFGVPIGSFQALKHRFADMLVAVEKARVTAYFAALTIAEDDARRHIAASMAKAAAGDCQRLVASSGIQIHGGIGFTWEHDVHLWVKRAKTGELLFGSSPTHRRRIADHLFD